MISLAHHRTLALPITITALFFLLTTQVSSRSKGKEPNALQLSSATRTGREFLRKLRAGQSNVSTAVDGVPKLEESRNFSVLSLRCNTSVVAVVEGNASAAPRSVIDVVRMRTQETLEKLTYSEYLNKSLKHDEGLQQMRGAKRQLSLTRLSESRSQFLNRMYNLSSALLKSDAAKANDEEGIGDDEVTHQSDLTIPGRRIVVVTTAALPWMTGTSVNPLLRAAHLCRMKRTKETQVVTHISRSDYNETLAANEMDDLSTGLSGDTGTETPPQLASQPVTLMIPWLELEEDRITVYGTNHSFSCPAQQEEYIRDWLRHSSHLADVAHPETGLKFLFYPARYHPDFQSIFAMGDICSLVPDDDADVCILEEPEHLNWYRAPGDGWTTKFNYVVGIMHTNYKEYAASAYTTLLAAPLIAVMSSAMVRAYCHQVIKLSDVLQSYAPEKEVSSNVHGVRDAFLLEGERRRTAAFARNKTKGGAYEILPEETRSSVATEALPNATVYFIGKVIWAKGFERLIQLEEYYRQSTGEYFKVDIYGSGFEEEEIKRAFHGRPKKSRTLGGSNTNLGAKGVVQVDYGRSDAGADSSSTIASIINSPSTGSEISVEGSMENAECIKDGEESSWGDSSFSKNSHSSKEEYFAHRIKARQRLAKFSQTLKSRTDYLELDLPRTRHELRRSPIPAQFKGKIDHALLTEQYKIFVNPSTSEVLCTTTAEALAMGKFAIIPVHASNSFFMKFPNCLAYRSKVEFAANIRWALTHEPEPLTPELAREFTWEAATERLVQAAAITKFGAHYRASLGRSKIDERIANLVNELGKGPMGDTLRKMLGAGPASCQVRYEMEKKGIHVALDGINDEEQSDDAPCEGRLFQSTSGSLNS